MFNFIPKAHAQIASTVLRKNPELGNIIEKIMDNILSPIIGLLFVLAFFYFVWGVIGMVTSREDVSKMNDSKRSVLWGVVGMTIMLSVYGIIRLIANTVGVDDPFL